MTMATRGRPARRPAKVEATETAAEDQAAAEVGEAAARERDAAEDKATRKAAAEKLKAEEKARFDADQAARQAEESAANRAKEDEIARAKEPRANRNAPAAAKPYKEDAPGEQKPVDHPDQPPLAVGPNRDRWVVPADQFHRHMAAGTMEAYCKK